MTKEIFTAKSYQFRMLSALFALGSILVLFTSIMGSLIYLLANGADIIWNYFDAVKEKWPTAWDNMGHGIMLNKTNGFKELMRF